MIYAGGWRTTCGKGDDGGVGAAAARGKGKDLRGRLAHFFGSYGSYISGGKVFTSYIRAYSMLLIQIMCSGSTSAR